MSVGEKIALGLLAFLNFLISSVVIYFVWAEFLVPVGIPKIGFFHAAGINVGIWCFHVKSVVALMSIEEAENRDFGESCLRAAANLAVSAIALVLCGVLSLAV